MNLYVYIESEDNELGKGKRVKKMLSMNHNYHEKSDSDNNEDKVRINDYKDNFIILYLRTLNGIPKKMILRKMEKKEKIIIC
jgi:hypothetical protein